MDLYPESIVYMHCHLFGEEWVEKPTDPLFGQVPVDARFIEAPLAEDKRITEKSTAEHMAIALIVRLSSEGYLDLAVKEERGWNFEVYEKVFCLRAKPLPQTPLSGRLSLAMDSEEGSLWLGRKRKARALGVSVDRLMTAFRKFRWFRSDPYRYACDLVRRDLMARGYYGREIERAVGPLLLPKWRPNAEMMAAHEDDLQALQEELAKFAVDFADVDRVLRDNVVRTLLKMRCDEEYMTSRDGDQGDGGESPI